jgi:hypothetical protein
MVIAIITLNELKDSHDSERQNNCSLLYRFDNDKQGNQFGTSILDGL